MAVHPDNLATRARHAGADSSGEIVAAVAGRRIAVLQAIITTDSSGATIQFTDSQANPLTQNYELAAGAVLPFSGVPWFVAPAGEGVEVAIVGNAVVDLAYALL